MLIWLLISAAVVCFDQLTKFLAVKFLYPDGEFVIIKNIFRFKYVENDGAAFGAFDDKRWIFMIASVIGIAALLIYLWKFRPNSKFACTALAFVIGGGIGNMIDRTFYTGSNGNKVVVDFIDFYAFPDIWMWVFNVADSFVCIGAGMLILWCIISLVKEIKAERAKKAAAAGGGTNTVSEPQSEAVQAPEENTAVEQSEENPVETENQNAAEDEKI